VVIRQRAIHAEHKQERHDALLDAALGLLSQAPDRVPSVADVADAAGLAKGTVYLYFPSKEELLLALHERNMHGFFAALTALVEGPGPVTLDAMIALTKRHLIAPPLLLQLAARCFGMMAQGIPAAAAADYRQRVSDRLLRAGAGLERHFPELGPGGGARLLRHSYALIIGLWQMSEAGRTPRMAAAESSPTSAADGASCTSVSEPPPPAFAWRYDDELERALRALWGGSIERLSAAAGNESRVQP
jgi:AcrR family transcriptional regulator